MTLVKPKMINDDNGKPIPVMNLSASQVVDGTAESDQSTPIDGTLIRIVSMDNNLNIAIGPASSVVEGDDVDLEATTTDIFIATLGELWLPIVPGHVVAVLGGKANICVAGV